MKEVRIAAVVVTYNRKESLKLCVDRLVNQSRPLDEIFVIDNGSSDETPNMLLSTYNNRVKVLRLDENIGGAGGFSFGIRWAYTAGFDWVWVLDDDAYAAKDCVANLALHTSEMNTTNVLWSRIIEDLESNRDADLDNDTEQSNHAMFVGYGISRQMIERIGFPDESLFIYWDDFEYTERVKRLGGEILIINSSKLVHKDWQSRNIKRKRVLWKSLSINPMADWRLYYYIRNQILINKGLQPEKLAGAIEETVRYSLKVLLFSPKQFRICLFALWHGIINKRGKVLSP